MKSCPMSSALPHDDVMNYLSGDDFQTLLTQAICMESKRVRVNMFVVRLHQCIYEYECEVLNIINASL